MSYYVDKQTYSERQAYRYRIHDEAEQVCYLAEPTGLFLPTPSRLVTLFNADHEPVGQLEPPPSSWRRGGEYVLRLGEEEPPYAVIEERWGLVDLILLRLPRYVLRLGEHAYIAQGSRYGARLYEMFPLPPDVEEEWPGQGGDEPEAARLGEEEMRRALGVAQRTPTQEPMGQISHPERGPHYLVEIETGPLQQTPLVLIALVVLVDLHLHGHFA